MNLTVSQAQGRVPVTIIRIQGDLDGSNYRDLIAKGQQLHTSGARDILLDLSDVPYMSSAGLVALHSLVLLARGEKPAHPASGWEALSAVAREQSVAPQQHVKLLNPQPRVDQVLATTGFDVFFEIHTNEAAAVASF